MGSVRPITSRRCIPTVLLVVTSLTVACSVGLPHGTLPAAHTDGLLKDAVLLPLTTRSTDGLLGRVWSTQRLTPDPARRAALGDPRHDDTHQHIEVLRKTELLAKVGAAGPAFGMGVSGHSDTDVAYSVDITGYDTLDADPSRYGSDSGCCVNGAVAQACEGGYVHRALRGSGRLKFLRRLSAGASASVGPVLQAEGGATYEVLDETTFEDAYFALFVEPLTDVCAHLAPEQELTPIHVVASDNCTIRVYSLGGTQRAHSTYFPNAEACWVASERACSDSAETPVACPATFSEADGSVLQRDLLPQNAQTRVAEASAPDPAAAPAVAATAGAVTAAQPAARASAGAGAAPAPAAKASASAASASIQTQAAANAAPRPQPAQPNP